MVVVKSKKELKRALKIKEKNIVVKGKFAKKVYLLSKFKGEDCSGFCENMSNKRTMVTMGAIGIPTIVAVTLIITVGAVAIVAILKDYSIKVKKGDGLDFEVELDR